MDSTLLSADDTFYMSREQSFLTLVRSPVSSTNSSDDLIQGTLKNCCLSQDHPLEK